MLKKRKTWMFIFLIIIVAGIIAALLITGTKNDKKAEKIELKRITVEEITPKETRDTEVFVNKSTEVQLPANVKLQNKDLTFIKVDASGKVTITPTKYNGGSYKLIFTEGERRYSAPYVVNLNVIFPEFDDKALLDQITKILGSKKDKYGVYVKDLLRDKVVQHNAGEVYLPGSIGKIPVVVLALKDIDAGKVKFTDTHPVKAELKHSTWDSIGSLAVGTRVSVKTLIEKTIIESNNTAMYHLRDFLGGVQVVDSRTRSELGVNTFMDAPSHVAIARNVGKVFEDVYNHKTLTKKSADYLFDLLASALPSLREGIPSQVPNNAKASTKVGFLFGKGLDAFGDAGVVFGENTDFVIVIIDKETPVDEGRVMVQKLAKVIYDALN